MKHYAIHTIVSFLAILLTNLLKFCVDDIDTRNDSFSVCCEGLMSEDDDILSDTESAVSAMSGNG